MHIKSFIVGLLLGISLLAGWTMLAANKPQIVGDSGTLSGYEVTGPDGQRICEDPWAYQGSKIIACE